MKRYGFSLVELAMVLVVTGLMTGFALQASQSAGTKECYATTNQQMQTIRTAIERFARTNDRLPLPAARGMGVENPKYGRETLPADLVTIDQPGLGTVSWGALPFQALGLTPSMAGDCWGNKFTYVVTTALTTNANPGGYLDPSVNGNITLRSDLANSINTNTAYAIISHGEDGLGAVSTNYSGASHGWCSSAGLALSTINCRLSSAEIVSAPFNNGKNAAANYFDDIVASAGRPQIIAAAPPPPAPIDGVCNLSCYVDFACNPTSDCSVVGCSSGTLANYFSDGSGNGTWECEGIDGGITVPCSVMNSPAETCPLPPSAI